MHSYVGRNPYIFFSYSHANQEEVMEIADRLDRAGFRVWCDRAMDAGVPFDNEIADHIKACDLFIIFLSKNYLNSPYCGRELMYAVEKERSCFTIYLDACDLSKHSGMEMFLRPFNNLYKKKMSEGDFYEKLTSSLPENCKRDADEEELDLSIRERLVPSSFGARFGLLLMYGLTAAGYMLRTISLSGDAAMTGTSVFTHLVSLIGMAVLLMRYDHKYAYYAEKNSLFSTYAVCGIVLNYDLALFPFLHSDSVLIQFLGGLLLFILSVLPFVSYSERKSLPNMSYNYLNTSFMTLISCFLTILLYGSEFRFFALILSLFMLIYPSMAINEKRLETAEVKKIIKYSSYGQLVLNIVWLLFLLFGFLFDLLLRLSERWLTYWGN